MCLHVYGMRSPLVRLCVRYIPLNIGKLGTDLDETFIVSRHWANLEPIDFRHPVKIWDPLCAPISLDTERLNLAD